MVFIFRVVSGCKLSLSVSSCSHFEDSQEVDAEHQVAIERVTGVLLERKLIASYPLI